MTRRRWSLLGLVALACGAEPMRLADPAQEPPPAKAVEEPTSVADASTEPKSPETAADAAAVDAEVDAHDELDVPPPHPPVKLSGPCVKLPDPKWTLSIHSMGVGNDGEMLDGYQEWPIERYATDLDGDGEDDWLVPVGAGRGDCPWKIKYRVYVMRGACGHVMGEVGPGNIVGEVTWDASGFRRLVFEASGAEHGRKAPGVPYYQTVRTEYAVSKGRYREVDRKVHGGDCHHCAASYCRKL